MNNNPIGIFDAGIGGLSIYQEVVSMLPDESIVYFGDNAYVPYSKLSADIIYDRSQRIIKFLLEKKAKAIVVACNTITVSCIDQLREHFPNVPIVGTVPVIKTAAAITHKKRFGILSTTRTANSAYQQSLIKQYADGHIVINRGTDEVAPRIDKGEVGSEELQQILEKVLVPFQEAEIDTLVLGCTHYPFVKKQIQAVMGEGVRILDSGPAIARQLQRVLTNNNALAKEGTPSHEFYTTAKAGEINSIVKKLLGITITSSSVSL